MQKLRLNQTINKYNRNQTNSNNIPSQAKISIAVNNMNSLNKQNSTLTPPLPNLVVTDNNSSSNNNGT